MKKQKLKLDFFAKVGEKNCEGKCQREVVVTKDGPLVICHGCYRIVMDNRK